MEEIFEGWMSVQVSENEVYVGYVREQTIAGQPFLRIAAPDAEGKMIAVEYISPTVVEMMSPLPETLVEAMKRKHPSNNQMI